MLLRLVACQRSGLVPAQPSDLRPRHWHLTLPLRSRNLLLVPRATVNVKPNLQIVADDVKCTHGCTVSDLEEEELFYLRYGLGFRAEDSETCGPGVEIRRWLRWGAWFHPGPCACVMVTGSSAMHSLRQS